MPFLKPLMPQTHTVPGFRLGPDLPRCRVQVRVKLGRDVDWDFAAETQQATPDLHGSKDVKRNTPTQQPTIPWLSLLRQRPRQCSTLQLTQ